MQRRLVAVVTMVAAGGPGLLLLRRPDAVGPLVADSGSRRDGSSPQYVGGKVCAECHKAEEQLWRGSHHDLAMQEATEQTVLGDFGDASYSYHDVTSTFFRKDGRFFVRTDSPDGRLQEYEIAYTFGIDPLQQYLIASPDGRIQALNVCWDARPAEQGGQRWFHLYPNENVTHEDVLHWTGPYQNWNHMCAECHSTNVRKGYDAAQDRFATTWSEINVSCEACHGPGSDHVAWANDPSGSRSAASNSRLGLVISLKERQQVTWKFVDDTGIARRFPPRESNAEIDLCARCHSRRGALSEDYVHGRPLMDTHRPVLLESSLFEHDGQIKDEVYEYQSFLQSKMYAAGVTCTDCHSPHTLKMPSGNAACATCHLAEKFDSPAHHFHKAGGGGSRCVDCHAPTRNYMVVHARHDHSFRVPRPDLTLKTGAPNACNQCHADRGAQWAADAALKWWGAHRRNQPHYGEALAAGHQGLPGAERSLAAVVKDAALPAIVRASAAALLGELLGPASLTTLSQALKDREPAVRAAAIDSLSGVDPSMRLSLIAPLLDDPVRMVRIDAARALAGVSDGLRGERRAALGRGLDEFRLSQSVDADRAEAHLNLGAISMEVGKLEEAEREYKIAIKLSPRFPATYVNLADLYRVRQRDDLAERVLREGLALSPDDAALPHALGLTLIREQRHADALSHLARAGELAPENARYAYVHGVALHSTGQPELALGVLRKAHRSRPGDRDILIALATFSREAGDVGAAMEFATKLVGLAPEDVAARRLLEELERGVP